MADRMGQPCGVPLQRAAPPTDRIRDFIDPEWVSALRRRLGDRTNPWGLWPRASTLSCLSLPLTAARRVRQIDPLRVAVGEFCSREVDRSGDLVVAEQFEQMRTNRVQPVVGDEALIVVQKGEPGEARLRTVQHRVGDRLPE